MMQRHPARRAHILALVGAALLIITLGVTGVKLGSQLIHYESLNHQNASAASYMYRLQDGVGNARACYFEYNATHSASSSQCYEEAVASLLNNFSDFSFYRSIELREEAVRPELMNLIQDDLEKILSWPHSPKLIPLYDGKVIVQLDKAFSELYHATSRDYTVRLVDIVRATSWERILGILGVVIGVISLISAGWVLDRALLGFRRAESSSRDLARRLRAVLDNLTIGVAVFGADGRLWHWNSRFSKLLGLKKDFLRQGLSYNALCVILVSDGMPLPEPFETIERRLADGEKMSPEVVEYKRGDGSEMELGRNLFFAPDNSMEWGGLVVTVSDITMRLRSERAMGEGKKLRAIGQLTAGVAHDFKNFLAIILGNIELAQEANGPESSQKRQKYLRIASDAVQHSETLTRQLLTFTRRKNAVDDVIDLRQLFSFLDELLERVIGRSISLIFHVSDDIWFVHGDGAQLECALINLAINGRDAMTGRGTLKISARNIEFVSPMQLKTLPLEGHRNRRILSDEKPLRAGRWVRIDVTDTGMGMSPDVMKRLFVPFFSTKEEGKGTGLGMAMVSSCIKDVGGCLMVESGTGAGTRVSLWLPAKLDDSKKTDETKLREVSPSQKSLPMSGDGEPLKGGEKQNILLIEDDPSIRNIVVSLLKAADYKILVADSTHKAEEIMSMQGDKIGLLITDIELPGPMNGVEFSNLVRQKDPTLPIIYMSGNIEAAEEGVVDSFKLSKPFGRGDLLRIVRKAFSGKTGTS